MSGQTRDAGDEQVENTETMDLNEIDDLINGLRDESHEDKKNKENEAKESGNGSNDKAGNIDNTQAEGVELVSLNDTNTEDRNLANGNSAVNTPSSVDGGNDGPLIESSQSLQSTSSLHNLLVNRCGINIPENVEMLVLVWISRALPCVAAIGAFIFIIVLLVTPENWETNRSATDSEVLDRESNRGLLVSVIIAILLNLIGALMFYLKVKESLVVTNYGFVLGPVIGYLLDQGIGTDKGFRKLKHGLGPGLSYTFSSLISGNFGRYIITVFLDLFISNPLQDVMKNQVKKKGVIKYLSDTQNKNEYLIKYDSFVVLNYPSILQSIVAFVTFNAYTNQTRFAWAYASSTLDRELRIPPGTIMLCTAIAGLLYLNFYNIMDYTSEREYFDVNTKLTYVMCIIGLLYALNATDNMEAPVDGEENKSLTAFLGDGKPLVGVLLFSCFVLYGFVYPLYTRLGCCGRYKPKSRDDHLGDESDDVESVQAIRNKVSDDVLDKVEEILKMAQGIDISPARKEYELKENRLRKRRKR